MNSKVEHKNSTLLGVFTKADILLILVVLFICLATFFLMGSSKTQGDKVVIELSGSTYGQYPLSENRDVLIKDPDDSSQILNTVSIDNGKVSMEKATCSGQDCIRHSSISTVGEQIVCLPNRVVVKVVGKGDGYDSISK